MTNGLVSPIIEGRPDFEATEKSCRQETNVISTIYGSAKGRGGTVYVASPKSNASKFLLVSFVVGERVAYVLELGDQYMRVYRYHETIMDSIHTDTIYEKATPYALSDFFDSNGRVLFDFKQSADTMYIVHEKYPPKKLQRFGDANWTLVDLPINNGPWEPMNNDETIVMQASGNTGTVTLTLSGGSETLVAIPTIDMELTDSSGQDYSTGTQLALSASLAGQTLASASWSGTLPESYADAVIDLLTNHITMAPALQGSIRVTKNNSTNVKIEATAEPVTYHDKSLVINAAFYWHSQGSDHSAYFVLGSGTFVDKYENVPGAFTADMIGKKIRLTQNGSTVGAWYANKQVAAGELCRANFNFYSARAVGVTGGQMPTHTEGVENDGGVNWTYLHSGYGTVEITGVTDSVTATAKVLDYIPQEIVSEGTYLWEYSLFGSTNCIWPCLVEFYKDRLLLGANLDSGPTIAFSMTGDYENFADISYGEQTPQSAMTLKIFTSINKLTWLQAQRDLYVGTEGSILKVTTITDGDVFGPDNITYDEISTTGSCKVRPIKIGDEILFLGPKGTSIYKVEYNFSTDSYEPVEISVLANKHLEQGIVAWAYQHTPNKMIWAIRSDGAIVGLVYDKKQQVTAFNIQKTQGAFETICVIPNMDTAIDEVWVGTKRTINSSEKRFIEYFSTGLPIKLPASVTGSDEEEMQYLLDNAIYLDCCTRFTYTSVVSSVSGLTRFNGQTVTVVADGRVFTQQVNGGIVTLSPNAKNILVGLPYTMTLELMPITQNLENGTGLGRTQRVHSVVARIYCTHSFKYGQDLNNLKVAKINPKDTETTNRFANVYNFPLEVLKSGDIKLDWPGEMTTQKIQNNFIVNSTGARLIFVQDRPFPVHWCAFSIGVGISEDIQ